jgi:hypothetical protein
MTSQFVRVRCTRCPAKWPITVTRPQATVDAFCVACGARGEAAAHWPLGREDAVLIWSQASEVSSA